MLRPVPAGMRDVGIVMYGIALCASGTRLKPPSCLLLRQDK